MNNIKPQSPDGQTRNSDQSIDQSYIDPDNTAMSGVHPTAGRLQGYHSYMSHRPPTSNPFTDPGSVKASDDVLANLRDLAISVDQKAPHETDEEAQSDHETRPDGESGHIHKADTVDNTTNESVTNSQRVSAVRASCGHLRQDESTEGRHPSEGLNRGSSHRPTSSSRFTPMWARALEARRRASRGISHTDTDDVSGRPSRAATLVHRRLHRAECSNGYGLTADRGISLVRPPVGTRFNPSGLTEDRVNRSRGRPVRSRDIDQSRLPHSLSELETLMAPPTTKNATTQNNSAKESEKWEQPASFANNVRGGFSVWASDFDDQGSSGNNQQNDRRSRSPAEDPDAMEL